MVQFSSHLLYESDQDTSTNATHLCILLHLIISNGFIDSYLKTMLDHIYGCEKQYSCAYDIYVLSCIAL